MSILQAAFDYAARGWRVHPLYGIVDGKCACRGTCGKSAGKHPILSAWQKQASSDEDTISEWWDKNPHSNLGVAFGEASGIIDIECDSPEIEKALVKLFGGEFPPCPMFQSGRGKHRIFKWSPDIPLQNQAVFKIDGIEFRTGNAGGAQSVFPPSMHFSGQRYRWIIGPDEADPPDIPERVLDKIYDALNLEREGKKSGRSKEEWDKIAGGVGEGDRNQSAAAFAGKYLQMIDVHDNDAVRMTYRLMLTWNRQNSPPMDEKELERTYNSILNKERIRRTNDEFGEQLSKYVDPGDPGKQEDITRPLGEWRLVIVDSKPRTYKLYSPLWSAKADGGCIELTSGEIGSVNSIATQAMEQAGVWIDRKEFANVWNGTKKNKGLGAQITESAEHESVPTEEHRDRWIASVLFSDLQKAELFKEDRGYTGNPQRLEDGSVCFYFERLLERYKFGPDGIKRNELSRVIRKVGGQAFRTYSKSGHRVNLKKLSPEAMESLEWTAGSDPELSSVPTPGSEQSHTDKGVSLN